MTDRRAGRSSILGARERRKRQALLNSDRSILLDPFCFLGCPSSRDRCQIVHLRRQKQNRGGVSNFLTGKRKLRAQFSLTVNVASFVSSIPFHSIPVARASRGFFWRHFLFSSVKRAMSSTLLNTDLESDVTGRGRQSTAFALLDGSTNSSAH